MARRNRSSDAFYKKIGVMPTPQHSFHTHFLIINLMSYLAICEMTFKTLIKMNPNLFF